MEETNDTQGCRLVIRFAARNKRRLAADVVQG